MDCRDLEVLLSSYADNELQRTQKEFVEQHLSNCPDCQETINNFRVIRQQLISLRSIDNVPDLRETIMSRINKRNPFRRSVAQLIRPVLISISILFIVLTLLVLHPWSNLVGPQVIIAKAYKSTSDLQSYRVINITSVDHAGTISEEVYEWDFVFPDRRQGTIILDGTVHEFIIIGDDRYYRKPANALENFYIGTTFSPAPILSKENTLQMLEILSDRKELPSENIEGMDTYHYSGKGNIDLAIEKEKAKLNPAQAGYEDALKALEESRDIRIKMELWIGKDDYLIRQLKREIQIPADDNGIRAIYSSVVKYFDFNKSIRINPPLTSSGEIMQGWELENKSTQSTGIPYPTIPPYPTKTPD